MKKREITEEVWNEEGKILFGPDKKSWKFKCPMCGHVASVQDWLDLDGERMIAFSCIGRLMPKCRDAFETKGSGPCNYAGGGFFNLNPVRVKYKDGIVELFDFSE